MSERRESSRTVVTAMRFTGMGWSIAVAVILGVLIGNWLDGKAGTHPLFLILGILVGLAGSFAVIIRLLIDFVRQSENN